ACVHVFETESWFPRRKETSAATIPSSKADPAPPSSPQQLRSTATKWRMSPIFPVQRAPKQFPQESRQSRAAAAIWQTGSPADGPPPEESKERGPKGQRRWKA